MIKVTVGNNVKRESVIIDENTTLRSCLEANGVDYTRGVMHLDGSSLNPGDLEERETYEELAPLVRKIRSQNRQIHQQMGISVASVRNLTPSQST